LFVGSASSIMGDDRCLNHQFFADQSKITADLTETKFFLPAFWD
jgi:hypothetical protein